MMNSAILTLYSYNINSINLVSRTKGVLAILQNLKAQLKAWWDGDPVLQGAKKSTNASLASGAAIISHVPKVEKKLKALEGSASNIMKNGKPLWSATRLEVCQSLWGSGLIGPGDMEFLEGLVKPFALNPAMSVLDLSPGLGTLTRHMVDEYGVWVTGYDNSEFLAEVGNSLSVKLGYERQARISYMNFENLKFDKKYDCVISKDKFFLVMDKAVLFDQVEDVIKEGGQMLFIDFMLIDGGYDKEAILEWEKGEPFPPTLSTLSETLNELTQRNFDIRITLDLTRDYEKMIKTRIAAFLEYLKTVSMEEPTKEIVTFELDIWMKRLKAMSAGLKVYKFHVLKRHL